MKFLLSLSGSWCSWPEIILVPIYSTCRPTCQRFLPDQLIVTRRIPKGHKLMPAGRDYSLRYCLADFFTPAAHLSSTSLHVGPTTIIVACQREIIHAFTINWWKDGSLLHIICYTFNLGAQSTGASTPSPKTSGAVPHPISSAIALFRS